MSTLNDKSLLDMFFKSFYLNPSSFLLFFFCTIFFTSCDDPKELTRKKAKKLIIEYCNYPNVELIKWRKDRAYSSKKLKSDKYAELLKSGVIEFKKRRYEYNMLFTKKGMSYVHKETKSYFGEYYHVASCILQFDEVTGIQLNTMMPQAGVNFNVTRTKVTPFGKFKGYENGQVIKENIYFELFDDGWRIDQKKPIVVKPDEVPYYQ